MSESILIEDLQESDFDTFLAMGLKLWPNFSQADLRQLLDHAFKSDSHKLMLAKSTDGSHAGFIVVSIRQDYVEGAINSPTGYLEGIFVESEFRKSGVAKSLVHTAEQWLKQQGCTQMGSDTWVTDTRSRAFHKSLGFWEEEELVHFLKNIE